MRPAVTELNTAAVDQNGLQAEHLAQMATDLHRSTSSPVSRDWSNIAFAVSFCEESRRDYEALLAS